MEKRCETCEHWTELDIGPEYGACEPPRAFWNKSSNYLAYSTRANDGTTCPAWQPRNGGWVRVEDGLPEPNELNEYNIIVDGIVRCGFFTRRKRWLVRDGVDITKYTSHWMELPPGPENEAI